MAAKISNLRAYFNERIIRMPIAGCWLWTGSIESSGYAVVQSTHSPHRLIHRLSWHWFVGPVPDDLFVLHKCDVKCCVNPNHLFLGTLADNNKDRKRKGRNANTVGCANPSAKLNKEQVAEVLSFKGPAKIIARRLSVDISTIYSIRHGRTYRDITRQTVAS